MRNVLQHVECFHLVFLRLLEVRLDRAAWVVRGGVNLRAWFGSLRYSEDLDIDVVRGTAFVLQEKVDKLLAAAAFRDMLRSQGLELLRSSKPKQTDTIQRWKFEVAAQGMAELLHTRVEFSRRGAQQGYVLEPVRAEVVRPYGFPTPTANHYAAEAAIRQKIEALASRRETQARDVWDLELLLRTTTADLGNVTPTFARTLDVAVDRVMGLSFDVYKAQVVPYLAADHQEVYGSRQAWARICELVVDRLTETRR